MGEFQALLGELQLRERVMLWLGMTTGLRRGELAGLRWCDVKFEKLTIDVLRSVVDQRVGKVKTEASQNFYGWVNRRIDSELVSHQRALIKNSQ